MILPYNQLTTLLKYGAYATAGYAAYNSGINIAAHSDNARKLYAAFNTVKSIIDPQTPKEIEVFNSLS
jgi:hypothetical protein